MFCGINIYAYSIDGLSYEAVKKEWDQKHPGQEMMLRKLNDHLTINPIHISCGIHGIKKLHLLLDMVTGNRVHCAIIKDTEWLASYSIIVANVKVFSRNIPIWKDTCGTACAWLTTDTLEVHMSDRKSCGKSWPKKGLMHKLTWGTSPGPTGKYGTLNLSAAEKRSRGASDRAWSNAYYTRGCSQTQVDTNLHEIPSFHGHASMRKRGKQSGQFGWEPDGGKSGSTIRRCRGRQRRSYLGIIFSWSTGWRYGEWGGGGRRWACLPWRSTWSPAPSPENGSHSKR